MRTCVITGAGTGIGRATALTLSEAPDIQNYILISMGMIELEETRQLMLELSPGKNVRIYDQDITQYVEVEQIIKACGQEFGQIDVLCNIAGYSKEAYFPELTIDLFEKTFAVNVFAMFAITKAVVDYMKQQGGVIVNVASTSGSTPRPGWLPYAASKSAVIGFSKTLTYELNPFGIKVFTVSPGRCATEMRKNLRPDEDATKLMQPKSVAEAIAFFVNHMYCNLDGQDIIVRQLDP